MQVIDTNDVKIYNLSSGKSLPEWLSDRKKRALQKKDIDIRKRIDLIQEFDMPGVSTSIRVSRDERYIVATGIYKPRVKCFDVNNLSMKFERCFDSEVVTFEILSEDYSKLIFLQCDRYVELHSAPGRYYRLRIPKFGHDMKYHYPSCDVFFVGSSPDILRLNLERGQFLSPFTTEASVLNRCAINPVHNLLVVGTQEGRVEGWDPRSRSRVGTLDCAFDVLTDNQQDGFPSVTSLAFQGSSTMGVGTATGQILLYDIRMNKPFCTKDHMYGLPIKDIAFHETQNLVLSMDSSVLKIWDCNNAKNFTSIESTSQFNNLCLVPNSGLIFLAAESPKIQTFFIPSMGPAPRWCSFLDNITEELEESRTETVYDDYKFITRQELEELGLVDLIGTSGLRAFMHGYFVDIRLYKKVRGSVEPFAFEEYKNKKLKTKAERESGSRVYAKKLPMVNKDLALKLMNDEAEKKKKKTGDLLKDDRFSALFENPDFEVDINAEEYRLLNPVLSRLDKGRKKELEKQIENSQFEEVQEETDHRPSMDSDVEDSSDDDKEWVKEVQRQHRLIRREKKEAEEQEKRAREEEEGTSRQPKFFELKSGESFKGLRQSMNKKLITKTSLGDRLNDEDNNAVRVIEKSGNRQMTFSIRKSKNKSKDADAMKKHREERKRLMRPAGGLKSKPNYWSK